MDDHAAREATNARSGRRLSVASIVWTAVTSSVAIGLGIGAKSVLLVAFGAVGLFDMAGSIALVLHFRHLTLHQVYSARREAVAHRLITVGLFVVGCATVAASAIRLAAKGDSAEPVGGIVVAACSVVVLGYLGLRKHALGVRLPSQALQADGWLSLIGGATAACTVIGLALDRGLGWWRADPCAAIAVGVTAVLVAARSSTR